jgi:hypothetical protein
MVSLSVFSGPDDNPHRLDLIVNPAPAAPAIAGDCDETCEGICAVMNSAAAEYHLPYPEPGATAEKGFMVPGASWCGGQRAAPSGQAGADRTWYRCYFGSHASTQDADREFERVGKSFRGALAGWRVEDWRQPAGATGQTRRNLRAGNGEVLVELAMRRDGNRQRIALDFTTLYDPTFAPLCR